MPEASAQVQVQAETPPAALTSSMLPRPDWGLLRLLSSPEDMTLRRLEWLGGRCRLSWLFIAWRFADDPANR